jgi:hypothetical protein
MCTQTQSKTYTRCKKTLATLSYKLSPEGEKRMHGESRQSSQISWTMPPLYRGSSTQTFDLKLPSKRASLHKNDEKTSQISKMKETREAPQNREAHSPPQLLHIKDIISENLRYPRDTRRRWKSEKFGHSAGRLAD